MNDDFLFAEDDDEVEVEELGHWKILVVDDEPEVHAVTKLALSDFVLNDKSLVFLSAYSGEEAKAIFREHDDIAVVLLDVVMETDDAGLMVADYIRNELDNHFTRIILRTGQPGQAPEKDVIINYDINDYKSKTELTAQKLFTVIIAALRSYRDIVVIEESRAGLEKIIDASANLFSSRSLERFVKGLIQQMASILGCSRDAAYITSAVATPEPISSGNLTDLFVFAGNGEYADKEGMLLSSVLPEDEYESCKKALSDQAIVYGEDHIVAYCSSKSAKGSLLYLSGLPRKISETDKKLVEVFSENVQIAFENVMLTSEIEETQSEIIDRLGKALEFQACGENHFKRMVLMAERLANGTNLTLEQIALLKLAIPLHDVGNSRVPEAILTKTGPLTEDEIHEIRKHAEFGYQILRDSDKPTIKLAASLAREHHERWDGHGYPDSLKGEQIRIESRIATLVDVFDALMNERPYKAAWDIEKVKSTLIAERGQHFDPILVDYMLANIQDFIEIQQQYAG